MTRTPKHQGLGWAVAVGLALGLTCGSAAATPPALTALPAAHAQALQAIPPDPPPPKLTMDHHYLVSDEHRPHRFRTTITGLGGMLVGVGADQNYYYAGWAKPQAMVLLDFDQMVVDLHAAYRVFFLHSATPDEFLKLWSRQGAPKARQLLTQHIASAADRKRALEAYGQGRIFIHPRNQRLRAQYLRRKIPTFLTDQDQYDYVVALYRTGRVRMVRGDLTADKAMAGVAQAARTLGLPVRVLYISNTEQYFKYGDGFRRNVAALPYDAQSMVLRTVHRGVRTAGTTKNAWYIYSVQKAQDFNAWLGVDRIGRLDDIIKRATKSWGRGKLTTLGPPP